MKSTVFDFVIGIGGAAGQGIATPGNILARTLARRGMHLYAYNAHQSIIRGGHILLTLRTAEHPIYSHGDGLDLLLCLNQDTMNRHLRHMGAGTWVVFNQDDVVPGQAAAGVHLHEMHSLALIGLILRLPPSPAGEGRPPPIHRSRLRPR